MAAEQAQTGRPARRPRAAPLAPVALAVVAGVVADRYAEPWGTATWAALALGSVLLAAVVGRWEAFQRLAIVAAFVAIGGGWHHQRWSDLAPDHLARSIAEDAAPRPAWLRGVLCQVPEYRPPEPPHEQGFTRTVLDVWGVCDGTRWHRASGRVRLIVDGDRTDLAMGEPVEAVGTLGPIRGPRNPGEADFRAAMRARGIRLRLSCDAVGVWNDPAGTPSAWWTWLGRTREGSRQRLEAAIGPRAGPLAAALVLGRREAVDPDVNDAFARTGTTHLLAISGLHLCVLALAIAGACRLVGLGPGWSAGLAAGATTAYAALVGPLPSVVRSASMTLAVCLAVLRYRHTRPANVLALAALLTIARNPADVFDVGCQLSFLSVAVLAWLVPPILAFLRHDLPRPSFDPGTLTLRWRDPDDPLDALERRLSPRWKRGLRQAWGWAVEMLVVSAVVWTATAPLVALWFHLITPIGILLNVPLIPMTSLALVLAAVALGLSALWPPLAMPAAWVAAWLLEASEAIVCWGASLSWGHAFTPGPAAWWVLGFTACLAGLMVGLVPGRSARGRRAAAMALGGWLAGGLGLVLARSAIGPEPPEVEVLAVDHGLAVLVRDGTGRTLLYDCGRMGDPNVGRRVIAPALWARGLSRIDEIVLSHADSDHTNGLPDLLERFTVGAIRIAPGFGKPGSPEATLLEVARARGVTIRPIAAGEPWGEDALADPRADRLMIAVEHPPRDWLPGAPDNDRSLVLSLACRGRRLLLPGDLDGAGLTELVARPTPSYDAILAPHHGGRSANPPWFYTWARPGLVVVSQRPPAFPGRDPLADLTVRHVAILRTWQRGAIRLRWEENGIVATGFLDGKEVRSDEAASRGFPRRDRGERRAEAREGQRVGDS